MKNYSTFLTRKQINRIISAHETGISNAMPENIRTELNNCHVGRKGRFLSNLEISDEAKTFVDDFFTDVKNYEETGEGSNFAANFVD